MHKQILLGQEMRDSTLQCNRVRSEAEAQKHMKRRQKRKRQKISKDQSEDNADADATQPDGAAEEQQHDDAVGGITASDELVHLQV